jgi:hypothetical protein
MAVKSYLRGDLRGLQDLEGLTRAAEETFEVSKTSKV